MLALQAELTWAWGGGAAAVVEAIRVTVVLVVETSAKEAAAAQDSVGVFCTGKIQDGQDRAFLFRGGLVNYKAHHLLSWFKPLLGGNSPTSSGLILKMNSGYNGVSRALKKFTK
jgi:hypothetical protein